MPRECTFFFQGQKYIFSVLEYFLYALKVVNCVSTNKLMSSSLMVLELYLCILPYEL